MSKKSQVYVFGEVLFDCFPGGERVLGGAPFNVAWHLHALGDSPHFISRVGNDKPGKRILAAMDGWGMNKDRMQIDSQHQTGKVQVNVIENEPHYHITPECAYDFIDVGEIADIQPGGILYHGTLGLRHDVSRAAFRQLAQSADRSIFLDVNLRDPWWEKQAVYRWLEMARWVKLNLNELRLLGFTAADIQLEMANLRSRFDIEQVILTRGEQGAIVLADDHRFHQVVPEKMDHFVDTVGAGDAFTAIYIHGLISHWPISDTLKIGQRFASRIIGMRGATPSDPAFYQDFVDAPTKNRLK